MMEIPEVLMHQITGFKDDLESRETHRYRLNQVLDEIEDKDYEEHCSVFDQLEGLITGFYESDRDMEGFEMDDPEWDLCASYQGTVIMKIRSLFDQYDDDFYYRAVFTSKIEGYYGIFDFVESHCSF